MQTPLPSLRGLLQLFWRSFVFFPVAVVLMILYFSFWIALVFLPLAAALYACLSEWPRAVALIAAWIPLLLLTRWKRLHLDSKDYPNEHENV